MANSFVPKDHYKVLGIKSDASDDDIKKAFRAMARRYHPDTLGPNPTPQEESACVEAFKEAELAHTHVTTPALREQLDLWLAAISGQALPYGNSDLFDDRLYKYEAPEPVVVPPAAQFLIDGIFCWVEFKRSHWGSFLRADVTIQLQDIFADVSLQTLPHDAVLDDIIIVDHKGDVVGRGCYSLAAVRYDMRLIEAQERRNVLRREWAAKLDALEADMQRLSAEGLPVDHATLLLARARRHVVSGRRSLREADHPDTVVRAIREFEKELQRIGTTAALDVLIDDLRSGKLRHHDLDFNRRLLQQLRILQLRSGNLYEAPTSKQIEAHYRDRLARCRTHGDAQRVDLKLPDDSDAVMELVASGDIELAPDTIEVQGNKNLVPHAVEYAYVKQGDEIVPAGIITITEAAYERSSGQYGRVSRFPTLPHGILLLIRVKVKVQGSEIVSAARPDGKPLQNEVLRCRKGLRDPREASDELSTPTSMFAVHFLDLWPNY